MSVYCSFHCGDIFRSAKKANLPTTPLLPFPDIPGRLAVEMVIPPQVEID